jgi:hypothetical protein
MGRHRKYLVNDGAFDEIESQEQAYWLGFLLADGCIIGNRLLLELSIVDIGHIEKFLQFLESNYPIFITAKGCAKIEVVSNRITQNLIRYGCVERKSLILQYPIVHTHLEHHFIRGYFDGDGCICRCTTQNRFEVSMSGTFSFLEKLAEALPVAGNKILTNNGATRKIKYGGTNKVKDILDFLYKDSTVYLDRKKEKYDELCDVCRM